MLSKTLISLSLQEINQSDLTFRWNSLSCIVNRMKTGRDHHRGTRDILLEKYLTGDISKDRPVKKKEKRTGTANFKNLKK